MNILPHFHNNEYICQTEEDAIIAGVSISRGYVNATQMLSSTNKKLADWNRLKTTQAFIHEMSTVMGIPITGLIITIQGGNEKDLQGTWIHPYLAINLAMWISPQFGLWASKVLLLVLNDEYQALTPEAATAATTLKECWATARAGGKLARRTFTDAIKDYLDTHEVSPNYKQWIYSNCSDAANLALFGKKAKQLCEERGCNKQTLRDTHDEKSLKLLDRIEDYAMRMVDNQNYEPLDAMQEAVIFYCPD